MYSRTALAIGMVGICLRAAALPQYSLTDLGTLAPLAINDNGQVVGLQSSGGVAKAFLYSAGQTTDLSFLGGASVGRGINASGQVAISGDHPALYDTAGMHPLSAPPGTTGLPQPVGINTAAAVLTTGAVGTMAQVFVYASSSYANVGPTGKVAEAGAINDAGWVTGMAYNPDDYPFLYKPGSSAQFIPRLSPDTHGKGNAINNLGDVAGDGQASNRNRAFFYSHDGQLGELLPLNVPGAFAQNAYAHGINDQRLVVGVCGNANNPAPDRTAATLWLEDGTPQGLTTLLDSSGQGWTLAEGIDINNVGQIVGWGWYDSDGPSGPALPVNRGVLLTPVPEPAFGACFTLVGWFMAIGRRLRFQSDNSRSRA